MSLSNTERQRRWQAKHLVKLTDSAEEITAKLRIMPDQEKLCQILTALAPQSGNGGPELKLQLIALRRQNAQLSEDLRRARARLDKIKADTAPAPDPNEIAAKQIASLRKQLREARARLRRLAENPKGTVYMDRVHRRKIVACLHPDRSQEPEEQRRLTEAFQLFTTLPIVEVEVN
jgi:hypothetical protein